jgi:hypothetical protein
MDVRCGECGIALPADATTCTACGRALGSAPAGRRPRLLVWAAVAAAAEVALTLLIFRSCG